MLIGLACVVGAIVGGGLKILGVEIPVLTSLRRQALLAGLGVALVAGAGIVGLVGGGAREAVTPRADDVDGATDPGSGSTGPVSGATDVPSCYEDLFRGVDSDRILQIGAGPVVDVPLLQPGEPLDEPSGLRFTSAGRHLGAMRFVYYPDSHSFEILSAVNAACEPIDDYRNETAPSRKGTFGENHNLRISFGGDAYRLLMTGGSGFFKVDSSPHERL